MKHVALLRGINVGGNNIIPMKALAAAVTEAGYRDVSTYIASGNVLFDADPGDARALERHFETVLGKRFDYQATVVVRSRDDMAALVEALPRGWTKPRADTRYNVLFLRHTVDAPSIVAQLGAKPGLELVTYAPGTLFWSCKLADTNKTAMNKLSGTKLYKDVTVRNLNTTRKLASLALEDGAA